MAGRPPKVEHIRDAFLESTDSARALYKSVLSLSGINPNSACPRLHAEHAHRVVELAFLGMVSAWEEFLEQVFVRYMVGAQCNSGFQPPLRLGKAANIAHAYQVLSGDVQYDPNKHYSRFSQPKWVIDTSKLYFERGSPFATRLHPRIDPLQHAVKLRNRVAHSSTKVRSDFKSTAQNFLGLAPTQPLRQGYRVGDLLVSPAQRIFGQKARQKNWSYFIAYGAMYRQLAKRIVP